MTERREKQRVLSMLPGWYLTERWRKGVGEKNGKIEESFFEENLEEFTPP